MGLAAAGLTLFLSCHTGNYAAMLFKAILLHLAVGWWFTCEMSQLSPRLSAYLKMDSIYFSKVFPCFQL